MNRKWYVALALAAAVVLGSAAVWMGSLNQDEGWYLYAANLVAGGKMPYRDFAFTQGPVLPYAYSLATGIWRSWGLLGARIFNLALGVLGIGVFCLFARRTKGSALVTFLLLGCNLYHLYYLAIPKTYALAALAVACAFYLLTYPSAAAIFLAGVCIGLGAGVRVSLLSLVPFAGLGLLMCGRNRPKSHAFYLLLGAIVSLAAVYGPFLLDPGARAGLAAAQLYHAARAGFDVFFVIGSVSRLVRWYLPLMVAAVLFWFRPAERDARFLMIAVLSAIATQMLAPFPYDDYQVPLMGALAALASVAVPKEKTHVAMLLAFALAFGSPLLEKWSTDGQDRIWPLKKTNTELAQLRDAARDIEALDPGGKTLLTQDLYLAIETGREVPAGLEMGPFSILSHDEWIALLELSNCPVAAISGYTFAIDPPECTERKLDEQFEFLKVLKKRYDHKKRIERFGQNSTTLLLLKLKESGS